MKVSCVCPTYNRPPDYQWLLEESIESFLRQDHPEKELIVLNDCPEQELVCEAPGVSIINVPRRFHTIGEKYNGAIALSDGEFIAPWDDDDITLPWRLSKSLELLGNADYYNPRGYWLLDSKGLHLDHHKGPAPCSWLYTRRAFDLVDGYPHMSDREDRVMNRRLRDHPNIKTAKRGRLSPSEWYYVYRWGISAAHLSHWARGENRYREIGSRPVRPGVYILRPHWREDYVAKTRSRLAQEASRSVVGSGREATQSCPASRLSLASDQSATRQAFHRP